MRTNVTMAFGRQRSWSGSLRPCVWNASSITIASLSILLIHILNIKGENVTPSVKQFETENSMTTGISSLNLNSTGTTTIEPNDYITIITDVSDSVPFNYNSTVNLNVNNTLSHFNYKLLDRKELNEFIENENEELILLLNKSDKQFNDAYNTCWLFIDHHNDSVGQTAMNKLQEFIENQLDLVNRSKELNNIIQEQHGSISMKLVSANVSIYEKELELVIQALDEFKYLYDLINIIHRYKQFSKAAYVANEEYKEFHKITKVEDVVKFQKQVVETLNKFIEEQKKIITFKKSRKLIFNDRFTRELLDTQLWESEIHNRTKTLHTFEKLVEEDKFKYLLFEYVQPIFQGVILLIGMVGNSVLFIIFIKHKNMLSAPNLIILNLTIGDLLSLIINIVIFNIYRISNVWVLGSEFCKAYSFFRHLFIGVSVYSVVVISVQRFFALTDFFKWQDFGCRLLEKYKSILIIILIWIIASVIALSRTIKASVHKNKCYTASSATDDEYFKLTNSIDFVVFCLVPLLLIGTTSSMSARRLKESVRNMPGEAMGQEELRRARVLSSNILIALTIAYAVSYVPYFLFMFIISWGKFSMDNNTLNCVVFVTYSLIFTNSCFNPIALYLVSKTFRRYMNIYLFCICENIKNRRKISSVTTDTTVETKI